MAKGKKSFLVSGILTLDMQRFTVGMQKASRDLGNFHRSLQKTYGSMKQSFGTLPGGAGGLLGGLGAGYAAKEALEAGDAFNALQRRLKMVTKASGDYAAVSDRIFEISQRTYTSIYDSEMAFRTMAQSAKELGATNDDVLKVVETVNKLGVLSGASADQISGAMRQFTQVMGKGRLMSQELNIIAENMDALGRAIREGLGLSFGELRKKMEAGEITAKMVFDAILRQSQKVNQSWLDMSPTLSNLKTQMKNAFAKEMGDDAAAPIKAVGAAMKVVTNNMDSFIRGGAMIALVAGLNMARMALGSYYGMLESTVGLWNKASGAIANAARAKVDLAAATRMLTDEEVRAALQVGELAKSKGVDLSFSNSVYAAEAKAEEAIRRRGELFMQSETEQQALRSKAAAAASSWAVKVEAAEQRAAKAIEAANYQRKLAQTSLTGGDANAMQKAIKMEELATANLAKVREAAAASAEKYGARAEKLAETWAKKSTDASVAVSVATQEAMLIRAREITQMEAANGAGLAAKAIKDGETAAVVNHMRVLDLDTAARMRNNAAMTASERIGRAAAVSMNLFKAAGSGILTLLGGWPGVIFGAVTAFTMFGDKLDWLWGKQNKLNKSLEEFIRQKEEMSKSAVQIDNEKIQEAQAQLQELQTRRRGMRPATQWVGTPFGAAPIGEDPSKVRALEEDIRKKEAIIERLIKARDRDASEASSMNQGGSNYAEAHLNVAKETSEYIKTIARQTRPAIGMNATPRMVY